MWKAGFYKKDKGLNNPWHPAVTNIIRLGRISSQSEHHAT